MILITGAQIRAARALIRWSAEKLAEKSKLGVATIRRADAADGEPSITLANVAAIQATLEAAGIIFVAENGEGAGVRLRKMAKQEPRQDMGPGTRVTPRTDIFGTDTKHLGKIGLVVDPGHPARSVTEVYVRYADGDEAWYNRGILQVVE